MTGGMTGCQGREERGGKEPLKFLTQTTWLTVLSFIYERRDSFPKVGSKRKMLLPGRHFSLTAPEWTPQVKCIETH